MLLLIALFWGFTLAQEPMPSATQEPVPSAARPPTPPATFVGAAEIESTMRESIANNTLDKRVALAPGARGSGWVSCTARLRNPGRSCTKS